MSEEASSPVSFDQSDLVVSTTHEAPRLNHGQRHFRMRRHLEHGDWSVLLPVSELSSPLDNVNALNVLDSLIRHGCVQVD